MSYFYSEKFLRNPFDKKQQEKIRKTVFAIIGMGGTGGFIFENLLRLGAEHFIIFDHDRFELSNFNRQILAKDDFIDKPKTHAAMRHAKAINRSVRIKTFKSFGPKSAIGKAAVIIDGADNIKTKLAMAFIARKKKIPYVFCSANDSRGIVTVFTNYSFEKAFHLPKDKKQIEKYTTCSTVLCPTVSLAGTLAVSQAVNYILGKPYVKAPKAVFFDIFRKEIFWRARLG